MNSETLLAYIGPAVGPIPSPVLPLVLLLLFFGLFLFLLMVSISVGLATTCLLLTSPFRVGAALLASDWSSPIGLQTIRGAHS